MRPAPRVKSKTLPKNRQFVPRMPDTLRRRLRGRRPDPPGPHMGQPLGFGSDTIGMVQGKYGNGHGFTRDRFSGNRVRYTAQCM